MKIVALTSVSGPYIFARYSSFANQSRHNLTLIELGASSTTYPWEHPNVTPPYKRVILSDQPAEVQPILQLLNHLLKAVSKIRPDVVIIPGYARPAMLVTLLWCIWHGKTAILLSETTENDEPRSWWKEKIKKLIIARYKAALVGGQPQKRYLIKLGMPSDAIFLGYDVVGNDVFHPNQIKSLSCPLDKQFFLAINRFVTKKNLPFLLSAYAMYLQKAGNDAWDLVLCGDGELRLQIEQLMNQLQIQNSVHLPGFLQQDQLLPYFAHAQCFIHTSIQEQWGLVINEAMAAGLPVLVSNRCGCYEDLIIEGVNGFGFDPENTQQLTDFMLKMSSGEIDLESMGNAALEHIQQFSPDYFAQGLIQAIENPIIQH
jgi:1,2-diacylglycerol 3-alpha-glucosyltransferase